MNKFIKRLFAPMAIFAISLGVTISVNNLNEVGAEAAVHSFTVTRSNFASGALAYNVDDAWSVTDTAGNTVSGTFDLYSTTSQTTMQSKNSGIVNNFNNKDTMLPGNLTEVSVVSGTGTSRTWTLYASISTPLTRSNYTSAGTNLTGKDVTGVDGATTSWTGITGTYKYIYLAISGGASYANSITVKYDIPAASFGTLDHITVAGAKTSYVVGETFTTAGMTVTAFDTVGLSKTVISYTTNKTGYTFQSSDIGTITVTVSYTEGVTKTATFDVTVLSIIQFSKITATSSLYLGAEYVIVAEGATNPTIMTTTYTTFFNRENVTITSGNIVKQETHQIVKLVISPTTGTYGLQLVNGSGAGNYLAITSDNNNLNAISTLDNTSSWFISFGTEGETGNAIINSAAYSSRNIKYNNGSPRFATYTSAQTSIQLYLNLDTVNHTTSANMYASEVNTGKGNTAKTGSQTCKTTYEMLDSVYGRLSVEAKAIVDGSSDAAFVNARARMAYLASWTTANPGARQILTTTTKTNLVAVITIGAIALTSLLGYYILNKKKMLG